MPLLLDAQLLFQPPTSELRFLPEGPYPFGEHSLSWVAIQHAEDQPRGSLNILNLISKENREYPLAGRPGFAFATSQDDTFVIGMERQLGLYNRRTEEFETWVQDIDQEVEGTIVNDAVCFSGGLVLGCKDLQFETAKAGLYLWRKADRELIRLRSDQICSNGKIVQEHNGECVLLDIDTPTKRVVRYPLNVTAGTLGEPEVVLDLNDVDAFPDGMIATPDGRGAIISFYNPSEVPAGETRQYDLETGELQTVWRTPGSPRNTCPQLIRRNGSIALVITTAVEGMGLEEQHRHPNAGALFIGKTNFDDVPSTPTYEL